MYVLQTTLCTVYTPHTYIYMYIYPDTVYNVYTCIYTCISRQHDVYTTYTCTCTCVYPDIHVPGRGFPGVGEDMDMLLERAERRERERERERGREREREIFTLLCSCICRQPATMHTRVHMYIHVSLISPLV